MTNLTDLQICIVGGFPRAGTRQFTDIMNQHPDFDIKGEVYTHSFRMAGNLLVEGDKNHDGRWSSEMYYRYRLKTALNIIAGISKGSNHPFSFSKKIVGFKTPKIEHHKNTLDQLFTVNTKHKIKFFFCVRNLVQNFLSANSAFNVEAERYIQQTTKSINYFFKILNDKRYETYILDLDSFIKTPDKDKWVKNNIFDNFQDINITIEECSNFLSLTTNRNATSKMGRKRKNEIDSTTLNLFKENRSLQQAINTFEEFAKVKLWNVL